MAKLTFTGRSKDGKRLLLVDESGQEHTLAIDARLRRALSGAPESNGQLEIPMESSLRPRDIQTRIRAGESPESVAHAAGTSVEKIMPFAAPVMAERAHVAERAQLASVRRRASESGARTLGEAVAAHLRAHNADPGHVDWDAFRREDGRWTLTALYDVAGRTGAATFSHDPRGNFVTVDDEDARWLVGDATPAVPAEPASDDLALARQRRLSAIGDDAPLGEDAIEMVGDEGAGPAAEGDHATHDSPNETTMEISASPEAGAARSEDDEPAAQAPSEPVAKPAKKRGRASVPSWDEIMFGGGKND
jgi:hypothetical protein